MVVGAGLAVPGGWRVVPGILQEEGEAQPVSGMGRRRDLLDAG